MLGGSEGDLLKKIKNQSPVDVHHTSVTCKQSQGRQTWYESVDHNVVIMQS